jgi:hypothetical protein
MANPAAPINPDQAGSPALRYKSASSSRQEINAAVLINSKRTSDDRHALRVSHETAKYPLSMPFETIKPMHKPNVAKLLRARNDASCIGSGNAQPQAASIATIDNTALPRHEMAETWRLRSMSIDISQAMPAQEAAPRAKAKRPVGEDTA